jgi:DNA-directed RNA polymerase subunit RPC12/RpoP
MSDQKKYKCANCRKVLFFAEITEAIISKDCSKCGQRNLVTVFATCGAPIETIVIIKK